MRPLLDVRTPLAWTWPLAALAVAFLTPAPSARGQMSFEDEPINYYTEPLENPITRLQKRLEAGEVALDYDSRRGYLPSVLQTLGVPLTSQMLVFSKTSLQRERISPQNPRALYFTDDVYIGWVPGGEVVEISVADPRQGGVFFTLSQRRVGQPRIVRDRGDCLSCHASSRTWDVPGHLVRSVYSAPSGQPHFGAGTFNTTHASPLEERWGGWYVSGTHGRVRHMGNVFAADEEHPEKLDREAGANLQNLSRLVDLSPYLRPHSDIVALMVLEHQAELHNLITRANFDTRRALRDGRVMNELLGEAPDHISDSTRRRIENAGEKLVRGLLFCGEAKLTDPIQGVSGFAEYFAALGPSDSRGRSLRQFDLQRRMFRYPCSYLIYSEAFTALPDPLREFVFRRLGDILSGLDTSTTFAHLSPEDRRAILEILRAILRDTKSGLPDFWKK